MHQLVHWHSFGGCSMCFSTLLQKTPITTMQPSSTISWYGAMIFRGFSSTDSSNGLTGNAIHSFIEDKWRNLTGSGNVSGSRVEVITPRLQGVANNPPLSSLEPLSVVPLLEYVGSTEPPRTPVYRKTIPECNAMILEALSSIEDPNGADIDAILSFIEQRHEVPQNFRRSLIAKLRRLVLKGKLEKVDKCYKIKGASFGTETSRQKDGGPNNHDNGNDKQKSPESSASPMATETLEDAALYAAYAVAVAEKMSHDAIEACKKANRLAKIAEETKAMLKMAEELYEQCSRDGIVLLPPVQSKR